jgi:L-methionine (R)-S-oxide reductase
VACQTIRFGRGVCGAAAATQETQLVPNVEEFPGHIACDGESASEIVVPIVAKGKVSCDAAISARHQADICAKVVGIIDLDCAVLNGFDIEDQKYLEELAQVLAEACDW